MVIGLQGLVCVRILGAIHCSLCCRCAPFWAQKSTCGVGSSRYRAGHAGPTSYVLRYYVMAWIGAIGDVDATANAGEKEDEENPAAIEPR